MTLTTEGVWTLLRKDLQRFFRSRVRDEHRAEDLVQETFVRVHNRLSDLVETDRVTAWVFRVARNVLIDHARRGAHEATDEIGELSGADAHEENFNADVSGWARSMIELLPDDYRSALELHELEGLPQQAVADRLGLSLSGAKSRIQRGRAKLRGLLLDCCHLEFDGHGNIVAYKPRSECQGCTDCD